MHCTKLFFKKVVLLCFIPKTVKISRPQLYLDTLVIPHVSECKYLGIIVCQKNCDRDLKRQMKILMQMLTCY